MIEFEHFTNLKSIKKIVKTCKNKLSKFGNSFLIFPNLQHLINCHHHKLCAHILDCHLCIIIIQYKYTQCVCVCVVCFGVRLHHKEVLKGVKADEKYPYVYNSFLNQNKI